MSQPSRSVAEVCGWHHYQARRFRGYERRPGSNDPGRPLFDGLIPPTVPITPLLLCPDGFLSEPRTTPAAANAKTR
jgi:hypothetical protein